MKYEICPLTGETSKEELANHITHFIGLLLSIIGLPFLLYYSIMYGDGVHITSYAIYGTSLVLLYTASAWYHGCKKLSRKKYLRVFDHICIYILIAGTYTPLSLGPLREENGFFFFLIEWGIAIVGILLKLFIFNKFELISLIGYLAMGWLIVFNAPALIANIPVSSTVLIGLGGFFYTFGIIFYVWDNLPFNHSIWHLFVLGGSASHFFAVLLFI